jgi:hypothetical protein
MSPWRAAIDQALLLHKQPGFATAFQQTALPDGMPVLIRLASDEGSRRKDMAHLFECEESHLQKVAADYLLTVCLFPGSDDLRALGLNPSADLSAAKEHHRLLLKWLHPDRSPENQAYAERVNQAWSALKKAARTNPSPSTLQARSAVDVKTHAPPSGKFHLFLWGLAGLVVLLFAISAMPDAEVYVADVGSGVQDDSNQIDSGQASANQDNQIENRLKALGLTFGESQNIKKTSRPVETTADKARKPVTKKAEKTKQPINKQTEIARGQPLKPSFPISTSKPEKPQVASIGDTTIAEKKPVQAVTDAPNASPRVKMDTQPIPTATNPEPTASPGRNIQAEGQALVAEFRQRYKQGNSGSFMQLFGRSAANNRGDRKAIEADYGRLFVNTSSRKIDFTQSKWIFREDVIQFKAVYEASVRRKGDILPVTTKGRIDLIMSLENDALRIQQILLSE